MIDSHCHLTDPRLGDQLEGVLERARTSGVSLNVTIGTDPDDGLAARDLADRYDAVYFAAGIHPHYSGPFVAGYEAKLRELMAHPKCVALGEIGLEYHWKDVAPEHQRPVFRAQMALAAELGKSVVIHSRESVADALKLMADFPSVPAVFHCFTGTEAEARAITAAGYYLGFTGAVTFKKNDALRRALAECPADRVLIETDAPYMTPEPHRNVKINEPAYVRCVLECVAKVRGLTVREADTLTTTNTKTLYRIW